jgi:hypothetical protein
VASAAALQDRVGQFIRNYRLRDYMIAGVDPVERPLPCVRELVTNDEAEEIGGTIKRSRRGIVGCDPCNQRP